MASENSVILTDDNFEAEVLQSDLPVLVDFWADYCAPCKMIAPMVDELADEYVGAMRVGKFDMSENCQVAINYGVQEIPMLLLIKDGEMVGKFAGLQTKSDLKAAIDERLSKPEPGDHGIVSERSEPHEVKPARRSAWGSDLVGCAFPFIVLGVACAGALLCSTGAGGAVVGVLLLGGLVAYLVWGFWNSGDPGAGGNQFGNRGP